MGTSGDGGAGSLLQSPGSRGPRHAIGDPSARGAPHYSKQGRNGPPGPRNARPRTSATALARRWQAPALSAFSLVNSLLTRQPVTPLPSAAATRPADTISETTD